MPLPDSEGQTLPASLSPTHRSSASNAAQEPPRLAPPGTAGAQEPAPAHLARPELLSTAAPAAGQDPSAALVPTRSAPPRLSVAYVQALERRTDEASSHAWASDRLDRFLVDSLQAHRSVEGAMQRRADVRTREAAAPLLDRLYRAIQDDTLDVRWTHPLNGWNHVHVAAAAGDARLARLLIAWGVPPNRADSTGMTPLHLAAAVGSAASIEVLLEHGAHADAPGDGGFRPLHLAVWSGDAASLTALLRARRGAVPVANVDGRDPRFGLTPLHLAANQRQHEMLRILVAAGANPLVRARDGRLPLDMLRASTPPVEHRDRAYQQVCEVLEKAGEMAQARQAQASTAQPSTAQASAAQPSATLPPAAQPSAERRPRAGAAPRLRSSSV